MLSMCFVKLRVGIALYLFYQMLIPFVNINIGAIHLGANFVNFFVFISLFVTYGNKISYFEYKSLLPFLFIFVAQLFLIPFQTELSLDIQINNFRLDIMSVLLLPFAMINVMKFDKDAYKLLRNTLIISIIIAVIYGIFLTLIPGINPWLIMILPLNNDKFNFSYAQALNDGRIFGRISSVFSDVQAFGIVLIFSFCFIYSLIKPNKYNLLLLLLLLLLIIVAIFVSGIRTPILVLLVLVSIYLLLNNKVKLLFYIATILLIVYYILIQFPEMTVYFGSMFDPYSDDVKGSSFQLRMEQLSEVRKTINGNELTGLGYGWTSNYITTKGDHPILLAFESIIYKILCDSGIYGAVIWSIMVGFYFNYSIKNFNKRGSIILIVLLISYLSFTLITGDYGYMKYFLLFYVIIIAGQEKKVIKTKTFLSQDYLSKNKFNSRID